MTTLDLNASGQDFETSAETPVTTRSEYRTQRVLESLPGLLLFGGLLLPAALYFFAPKLAGFAFAAYLAYWMIRYAELAVRQLMEFFTMRRYRRIDWRAALAGVETKYADAYHLVVFATSNESSEIIEQSLDAVAEADYPQSRIAVCVTIEERSRTWTPARIAALKARYRGRFGLFMTTQHPDGMPGEGRVKGANLSWGAQQAREELHDRGIVDEQVIVSAFDADTRASRDYFSVLAYKHFTNPGRDVDSYQPILMYHNNIWDVPTASRLVGFVASFWTLVDSTKPARLKIFSSHAIGMKALVNVGYWSRSVIPDDSRQYWRMFFASDGRSQTVPLHTPVYLDAVLAGSYRATLREQYLQLRRWAYGVIDFPYIMGQNLRNPQIPFGLKALQTFRQISQFHLWATVPLMLLTIPQLIRLLGPTMTKGSAWLASISSSLSLVVLPIGLLVSISISLLMLPARPSHRSPWKWLKFIFEWLLMPIVVPLFICLPAIDAQFRLVFRRYLGFRVTVKNRHNRAHEITDFIRRERTLHPGEPLQSQLLTDPERRSA